jgi:Mg2+ and Co2+ transporter CorA
MPDWIRRISVWQQNEAPREVTLDGLQDAGGFCWVELACGAEEVQQVMKVLGEHCPGLTREMLEDLLTPDEEPGGRRYGDRVRLASSFSVVAWRPQGERERGIPQGVGVLRFQPVELLAGAGWLITCWHPQRTFRGSTKIEEQPPGEADELFEAMVTRWSGGGPATAGDLGVSVLHELALSYAPAHRALYGWLEDWELSLYIEDDLDNHEQLPELWGLMAVLRNWLNPLNRPGLRSDLGKAWLPATDHQAVVDVDDRVDRALEALGRLSETLRQSFGLLHLEQTEEQRRHSERVQHRVELAAAAFLVPTLIVGFYGANTWVPGQGQHWGFWVMVVLLIALSMASVVAVMRLQDRANAVRKEAAAERERMRNELLRSS